MLISIEEIQWAVGKAREISEIHRLNYLGADSFVRSTDDLRDLCGEYLEKKIIYREHFMLHGGQPVKGIYLEFSDGNYEIVLLGGQNPCWKRLVLCKEIFHVILDEDKYKSSNLVDLIDEASIAIPNPEAVANPPVVAEMLAEIAAVEYLFPYKQRKNVIANAGNSLDYLEIAERYKIPRIYVEKYLSKYLINTLNF